MSRLEIEFTNETLVMTERGIERLQDLLHRPVDPALWAVKWSHKGNFNGISFHRSHGEVKDFVEKQIDSVPYGPARLIDVSPWLLDNVNTHGYCWTNLTEFEEAKTYGGPGCKH